LSRREVVQADVIDGESPQLLPVIQRSHSYCLPLHGKVGTLLPSMNRLLGLGIVRIA
jgi:hypothetical protein